jgi:hypothetical protein
MSASIKRVCIFLILVSYVSHIPNIPIEYSENIYIFKNFGHLQVYFLYIIIQVYIVLVNTVFE